MRRRAKKRRVELLERILIDDRGKKTSTQNPNMSKESFRDLDSSSSEDEIKNSIIRRTLPIVQESSKSLATEKDTVNYMFRHRWNYFLRLLYSDGMNIPTVWTELATASKSERRVVIEESVLALAQE